MLWYFWRSHWRFGMILPCHLQIISCHNDLNKLGRRMSDFRVITVASDGLAPFNARTSTATATANFVLVYVRDRHLKGWWKSIYVNVRGVTPVSRGITYICIVPSPTVPHIVCTTLVDDGAGIIGRRNSPTVCPSSWWFVTDSVQVHEN